MLADAAAAARDDTDGAGDTAVLGGDVGDGAAADGYAISDPANDATLPVSVRSVIASWLLAVRAAAATGAPREPLHFASYRACRIVPAGGGAPYVLRCNRTWAGRDRADDVRIGFSDADDVYAECRHFFDARVDGQRFHLVVAAPYAAAPVPLDGLMRTLRIGNPKPVQVFEVSQIAGAARVLCEFSGTDANADRVDAYIVVVPVR